MRVHMCSDDRVSPGNLGIYHYPCKRGRSILEEATDRTFDDLRRYKVDYASKRAYAACTYYGGNVRFYALLCISDVNIFLSNCEALLWAAQVLYLAEFIGTACKKAHFTATSLSVLSTVHSVFGHTSICHMATKLYMGLHSYAPGNCTRSNKHRNLTQLCFA